MERLVASFPKNAREEIRVTLKKFRGYDLVDVRVFWSQDGRTWNPSKKGISIRVEQLPLLLGLLHKAAELTGECEPAMVEDDLLTEAEKERLAGLFGVEGQTLEEAIFG